MANKLIENVNEDVWRKFAGFCKMKNVLIGEELTYILKHYIQSPTEPKDSSPVKDAVAPVSVGGDNQKRGDRHERDINNRRRKDNSTPNK